jgi:glycerophosphoryl diester phosphodiesterase
VTWRPAYSFLDADPPLAFAHRGGAAAGPENSVRAFQRAIDLGYRYLETDVHATADGVLLAFHDPTLDRVTDARGHIAELPYAEVARARIAHSEPIPLLEDLLGAWPEVRINIDVKEKTAIGPLVDVIRRTGALDRVCVASFSDRRVAAVRAALGPRLCTSLGPLGVARLRLVSSLWWATPQRWQIQRRWQSRRRSAPWLPLLNWLAARRIPCAQVPARLRGRPFIGRRFLWAAHERGIVVHAWTVDDPVEMHRLLDLGVDGIMTDEPEVLRQVMINRGVWTGRSQ